MDDLYWMFKMEMQKTVLRYKFGKEMELTTEFDDEFTEGFTSLIDWKHLTLEDLDKRIAALKPQNAGNNPA